jgi:transposase
VELFEQIRREYEHGAGTIQGVARKLGVHRRMVREALANAMPPPRKTPVRERPRLDPLIPFIDAILTVDLKAPRKQRHTARRIFNRIRAELPHAQAAESTVRQYVRERKLALGLGRAEIFIPQSYPWGREAQVDWFEAMVEIDGESQKAYLFCMRSMASGGAFHRAYPHASQLAFLEAHEAAFHYFGGQFALLRYDNLKSAVQKILRGHQREETARFIGFRSHWGFESQFCNPGEGHEKGGVEEEGGYFRRNYLTPVPKARTWDELNQMIAAASKQDEQRIIEGRTQTIGAGMIIEAAHLRPLIEEGFDLAAITFPTVNGQGCVKVSTNLYSVPLREGLAVQARMHASYIEFWHGGECVARHERCFDRYQKVLDLEHYLDALTGKPGALAGSTPLEQWRAQGRWPASFDRFWDGLQRRQGKQDGNRAMIDALRLGRAFGYAELTVAIEKALEYGCFNVDAVRLLLPGEAGRRRPEAVDVGALRRYDRPQPTMVNYDQLLPSRAAGEVIQ